LLPRRLWCEYDELVHETAEDAFARQALVGGQGGQTFKQTGGAGWLW
jgi:hypothetical protein